MKIQYALVSCNSNMNYLGYWPAVAAAWRKLGITPVLFFIRDSDTVSPPPADGIVHTLEPLADVEISVQYTCARFWGVQLYPGDVVATSDIDLVPLSRDYFIGQLRDIPDDRYVHLGPLCVVRPSMQVALLSDKNAEWVVRATDIRRFRTYFHIARGSLLKEVLTLPDDWEQAARQMAPYNLEPFPGGNRDGAHSAGWGVDELYPTEKFMPGKSSRFSGFWRIKTPPHFILQIRGWQYAQGGVFRAGVYGIRTCSSKAIIRICICNGPARRSLWRW